MQFCKKNLFYPDMQDTVTVEVVPDLHIDKLVPQLCKLIFEN